MTALGLGTVQFGLDYGIANSGGRIAESVVAAILAQAVEKGITFLDTAPAYGDAEAVLGRLDAGRRFHIVTKTPYFGSTASFRMDDVFKSAELSRARLRLSRLDGILIHHPDDIRGPHARDILNALLELKARGEVQRIGISIYEVADLDAFDQLDEIDIVQLPLNILDQRLLRDGTIDRLRNLGVEIHVRSVFLQGLILMDPVHLPPHVDRLRPLLSRLAEECSDAGIDPVTAAIAFVRKIVAPDIVIVGVDNLPHLAAITTSWATDANLDWTSYAGASADLLDPRLWPKTH